MPTVEAVSNQAFAAMSVITGQPGELHATHDCHETMSVPTNEADGQPAGMADASLENADCHDGNCQLCGVCHQSASLSAWPLLLPGFLAHPLPVSATGSHAARMSAPLIKPPIS